MKNILITTLLVIAAATSYAQEGFSTLSYSIGFPMGDLKDFTNNVSGRGVTFDYNYLLNDNMAVGLGVGWQTFYENVGFQSRIDGTATLSGYEYHYVNSFPIHITGTYFVNKSGFTPYFGLGVGTLYNMTDTDIGIFRFEDNQWQFSLRPEAGVQFDLNYLTGIRVSARYNHAFESGNVGSISYFALGIGVVWIY